MQERGLVMLLHSTVIGLILYAIMFFANVNMQFNEDFSILLASIILIYMILFGHSLPNTSTMNKNIFGSLQK